jgi:hypothetical protein
MTSRRNNKLDRYHWHEALDRSSLALEWFAEFVEEHPVVRRTAALRKMAGELTDGLYKFYQSVANADPNFKPALAKRKGSRLKR